MLNMREFLYYLDHLSKKVCKLYSRDSYVYCYFHTKICNEFLYAVPLRQNFIVLIRAYVLKMPFMHCRVTKGV